jgi:hypothetical protein
MIKIYIPDSWLDIEHSDFKADLAQHAFLAELRTAVKIVKDDIIEYSNIRADKLSLAFAKELHAMGVIIKGLPLWIEIESEDDAVPEGVLGSTYLDENENVQSHTWESWKKSNHTFMHLGDRIFIGSNAHTDEYLELNDLEDVLDDLLSVADIRALQTEYSVEE